MNTDENLASNEEQENHIPPAKKGKKESKKSEQAASSSISSGKTKMSLDFKDHPQLFEKLQGLLEEVNDKKYGRKVELIDLLGVLMGKLTAEDVQEIQESTYSKMDKVHLAHEQFNLTNHKNLSFEEYLVQELKLQ